MRQSNELRFLLITGAILAADQLTKLWADSQGWVVLNKGISFGLLTESPWLPVVLVVVIVCVMGLAIQRQFVARQWLLSGLVFGGLISNVIDRLVVGGVKDWLPAPGLMITNNLADWAIVGGLVYWAVVEYTQESKKRNAA